MNSRDFKALAHIVREHEPFDRSRRAMLALAMNEYFKNYALYNEEKFFTACKEESSSERMVREHNEGK